MKEFFIKVPIYDVIVKVTVGDKTLTKDAGNVTIASDGCYWLRVNESRRSPDFYNTIGHEVQHLVFEILDRAGMKLCRETIEAYTYLSGFLHQYIYKKL